MGRGQHRRFDLAAYNKARAKPFEERYIPEPMSGCWLWIGGINSGGYGWFKRDGKQLSAHRVSWAMVHGDAGANMVLHRCDVRCCVNPDHLFLGDHDANMADKMAKGRHRACKGEQHVGAKLTDADVSSIRSDVRMNIHIAKAYSVSPALISKIKSFKAWRHLP